MDVCLKRQSFVALHFPEEKYSRKMQLVALQRDQELKATFETDVSLYTKQFLVFVDETGCDRRDAS